MVRKLMDNEIDIAGAPIFFTSARAQLVQFLAKTTKSEMKFVFRSPKLSFSDNIFLMSFDKVWSGVIKTVLLLTTYLYSSDFMDLSHIVDSSNSSLSSQCHLYSLPVATLSSWKRKWFQNNINGYTASTLQCYLPAGLAEYSWRCNCSSHNHDMSDISNVLLHMVRKEMSRRILIKLINFLILVIQRI